jgi:hypothetical protein
MLLSLRYSTLRLPDRELEELASVLVEFAEDVHNDIGIWRSLEEYNLDFFGTRLPLVLRSNEGVEQEVISQYRIRHLLWVLYSELIPELVLSPTHQDLCMLAEQVANFLAVRFANIPRDSGVKALLAQPNKFGWDVKRKLLWLGTHSYLFRNSFRSYVENHGGKPEIPIIDDFVCQQTTAWSGLGAIDILAATLDITGKQRNELRSWYRRHVAYFRVLNSKGLIMEVMNIVNGKSYSIRAGEYSERFKAGQIVFGGLVPWDGEWYWSGTQSVLSDLSEYAVQELKNALLQKTPEIAYRYCDELAEKARERLSVEYREFVKYHGDDLAIYPDGLSMAADLQKQHRLLYESQPQEVISKVVRKHKLPNASPRMSIPPHLLKASSGVGVYFPG